MKIRDRVERELKWVNRGLGRYQRLAGQTLQWYEWDPTNSTMDAVYDEAGARTYLTPKPVRTLWILRQEGEEMPNEQGFYVVDSIHFLLSVDQITKDGLTDPTNAPKHEKDRIVWDHDVWDIRRYHLEGRIRAFTVTVGVDAVQVKPDEYVNDSQFQSI